MAAGATAAPSRRLTIVAAYSRLSHRIRIQNFLDAEQVATFGFVFPKHHAERSRRACEQAPEVSMVDNQPSSRPDRTLQLLAEGYTFVSRLVGNRRWTETRLMARPAICLSGADAPEVMYAPGRFTRVGSLPPTTLKLLQGRPSVNQLDGEAHRRRKSAFMALLDRPSAEKLAEAFGEVWRRRMGDGRQVVLLPEVERILCEAACAWVGLPMLSDRVLDRRAREFAAMVAKAGAAGPELLPALLLRQRNELWMRTVIRQVRAGQIAPPAGSPLAQVAAWSDGGDHRLDVSTAAVEVINLLRPIVAVARYVVFAAHALHHHPDWRAKVGSGDNGMLQAFAQEVRRYYPFFPAVAGRVEQPFEWAGRRFARGEWVLADLYGANHDPDRWREPNRFDPDRFVGDFPQDERIVAQGAGDPAESHRCPGERATIELIKAATFELARMSYAIPEQDLTIPLNRMPTGPMSGFVVQVGRKPRHGWAAVDLPRPVTRAAQALGGIFVGLGAVFITAPQPAARLFGLSPRPGSSDYVRALGFRDIGIGLALIALGPGSRRSLGALAVSLATIPLLDGVFVAGRRGKTALPSITAHALSGAALLGLAAVCRRSDRATTRGGLRSFEEEMAGQSPTLANVTGRRRAKRAADDADACH